MGKTTIFSDLFTRIYFINKVFIGASKGKGGKGVGEAGVPEIVRMRWWTA